MSLTEVRDSVQGRLTRACDLDRAMRHNASQRPAGGHRTVRLAASATAAASTFALVMPLALATTAAAAVRGARAHRVSLHAAKASSGGHQAGALYLADLTTFTEGTALPVAARTTASVRPGPGRVAATPSARGPPDPASLP